MTCQNHTLLHAGVPRLIDIVFPVDKPGFLQQLFGRSPTPLLRADAQDDTGCLHWRSDDSWEGAVVSPLIDGGYLKPGRVWIDRGEGLRPFTPTLADDVGTARWDDPEFGRVQVAMQSKRQDDGSGEVSLRFAWAAQNIDWVLVFAPKREQLDASQWAGKKAVCIVLDDLALCRPGTARVRGLTPCLRLGMRPSPVQIIGLMDPPFDPANEDLLAVDFGTYETMLAVLSKGSRKVCILPHPEPWFQQCLRIVLSESGEDCRVLQTRKRSELPAPVRKVRDCSASWSVAGMPSQCLRIPDHLRGHDLFDEVALGEECDRLVTADPLLLDAYRPCPKLFLATANNTDEGQVEHMRTTDRRVVVGFMAEMFNSVALRQTMVQDLRTIEQRAKPQRRGIRPILYSYPVSLTQAQMDDLVRSFDVGLRDSQLMPAIPGGKPRIDPAIDEATAAALGVLFHGFANLPIRLALDAFGPFATGARSDQRRELNVLSVDLGGGTSDLVLLHLGKDPQRPGWRVGINEAFGVPRAGLAVTMRIAALLKQELLQQVRKHTGSEQAVDNARKLLNTNFAFHPPGSTRPDHLSEHQWDIGTHRRRRTMAWYRLAEEIKRQLCDREQPCERWQLTREHLRELEIESLADQLDMAACGFARDDLAFITRQIFATVLRKVKEWLHDHHIDLVVLAGRSFRLPGLRENLDDLLRDYNRAVTEAPGAGRRRIRRQNIVDLEWLEQNWGNLDLQEVSTSIARDKALVVTGLVHRQSLIDNPTAGERLRIQFRSSARRNRYIGLAEKTMAGEGRNFVVSSQHMLAIADEQIVRPEQDIRIPVSPGSTGFFLKINFLGPGPLEGDDAVDPPLSLAQIFIDDEEIDPERELEEMHLIFRQLTASKIVLHGLETRRYGEDWQTCLEVERKDEIASVTCDGVSIRMDSHLIYDDFRLDGIVNPDVDIDDVGGSQPVYELAAAMG
jgi:hypothetical protein